MSKMIRKEGGITLRNKLVIGGIRNDRPNIENARRYAIFRQFSSVFPGHDLSLYRTFEKTVDNCVYVLY